jgi:hypothetical protein
MTHRAKGSFAAALNAQHAPAAHSISFGWKLAKLRMASLMLASLVVPTTVGFALAGPMGRWFFLLGLMSIAALMHRLARRCDPAAVVLSIDHRGMLDRRLMSRRIAWQEIAWVCHVDVDRSQVVDLVLCWPAITLCGTRWLVRMGGPCQRGFGVPAVTISMLLLDGDVGDALHAIAMHRPDLLHKANRGALSLAIVDQHHKPSRGATLRASEIRVAAKCEQHEFRRASMPHPHAGTS